MPSEPERMTRPNPLGMVVSRPCLVPYDPRWPELFVSLRSRLLSRLRDGVIEVHHVGSTAVPGLSAKPVLDVLIEVEDLEAALALVPAMESLGFLYGPEDTIEERHYFRGWDGDLRTHHISIAERGSSHLDDSIAFRDALRGSPDLAAEYEHLKAGIYDGFVRGEAHRGKTAFVQRVLAASRR